MWLKTFSSFFAFIFIVTGASSAEASPRRCLKRLASNAYHVINPQIRKTLKASELIPLLRARADAMRHDLMRTSMKRFIANRFLGKPFQLEDGMAFILAVADETHADQLLKNFEKAMGHYHVVETDFYAPSDHVRALISPVRFDVNYPVDVERMLGPTLSIRFNHRVIRSERQLVDHLAPVMDLLLFSDNATLVSNKAWKHVVSLFADNEIRQELVDDIIHESLIFSALRQGLGASPLANTQRGVALKRLFAEYQSLGDRARAVFWGLMRTLPTFFDTRGSRGIGLVDHQQVLLRYFESPDAAQNYVRSKLFLARYVQSSATMYTLTFFLIAKIQIVATAYGAWDIWEEVQKRDKLNEAGIPPELLEKVEAAQLQPKDLIEKIEEMERTTPYRDTETRLDFSSAKKSLLELEKAMKE